MPKNNDKDRDDGKDDQRPDEPLDGREIGPDEAFAHAALAVRHAAASGVGDFAGWAELRVDPEPVTIDDLNGRPLFHDFSVEGRGIVRASANSLVGSPVVALQTDAHRWSPEEVMATAEKVASDRLGRRVRATGLVCYSYPKIGVRVEDPDGGGRAGSAIVDVGDFSLVERFGQDELEGQTAYSFLDHAAQSATWRLRKWESAEREMDAWHERVPEVTEGGGLVEIEKIRQIVADNVDAQFIEWYSWHTVRYAPRCDQPEVFQLYAQQTSVYCAVATGQMILDFYKYHFDQDTIAGAMNTSSGGTTNPDQVTGYESLSNDGLTATYDTSASWSEAKAEIDANRPVKSGIPGHARAAAGWKRQNVFILGAAPKRWLKVFDPWPWSSNICDGGAVYWEDWDAVSHTNWIYVRHT